MTIFIIFFFFYVFPLFSYHFKCDKIVPFDFERSELIQLYQDSKKLKVKRHHTTLSPIKSFNTLKLLSFCNIHSTYFTKSVYKLLCNNISSTYHIRIHHANIHYGDFVHSNGTVHLKELKFLCKYHILNDFKEIVSCHEVDTSISPYFIGIEIENLDSPIFKTKEEEEWKLRKSITTSVNPEIEEKKQNECLCKIKLIINSYITPEEELLLKILIGLCLKLGYPIQFFATENVFALMNYYESNNDNNKFRTLGFDVRSSELFDFSKEYVLNGYNTFIISNQHWVPNQFIPMIKIKFESNRSYLLWKGIEEDQKMFEKSLIELKNSFTAEDQKYKDRIQRCYRNGLFQFYEKDEQYIKHHMWKKISKLELRSKEYKNISELLPTLLNYICNDAILSFEECVDRIRLTTILNEKSKSIIHQFVYDAFICIEECVDREGSENLFETYDITNLLKRYIDQVRVEMLQNNMTSSKEENETHKNSNNEFSIKDENIPKEFFDNIMFSFMYDSVLPLLKENYLEGENNSNIDTRICNLSLFIHNHQKLYFRLIKRNNRILQEHILNRILSNSFHENASNEFIEGELSSSSSSSDLHNSTMENKENLPNEILNEISNHLLGGSLEKDNETLYLDNFEKDSEFKEEEEEEEEAKYNEQLDYESMDIDIPVTTSTATNTPLDSEAKDENLSELTVDVNGQKVKLLSKSYDYEILQQIATRNVNLSVYNMKRMQLFYDFFFNNLEMTDSKPNEKMHTTVPKFYSFVIESIPTKVVHVIRNSSKEQLDERERIDKMWNESKRKSINFDLNTYDEEDLEEEYENYKKYYLEDLSKENLNFLCTSYSIWPFSKRKIRYHKNNSVHCEAHQEYELLVHTTSDKMTFFENLMNKLKREKKERNVDNESKDVNKLEHLNDFISSEKWLYSLHSNEIKKNMLVKLNIIGFSISEDICTIKYVGDTKIHVGSPFLTSTLIKGVSGFCLLHGFTKLRIETDPIDADTGIRTKFLDILINGKTQEEYLGFQLLPVVSFSKERYYVMNGFSTKHRGIPLSVVIKFTRDIQIRHYIEEDFLHDMLTTSKRLLHNLRFNCKDYHPYENCYDIYPLVKMTKDGFCYFEKNPIFIKLNALFPEHCKVGALISRCYEQMKQNLICVKQNEGCKYYQFIVNSFIIPNEKSSFMYQHKVKVHDNLSEKAYKYYMLLVEMIQKDVGKYNSSHNQEEKTEPKQTRENKEETKAHLFLNFIMKHSTFFVFWNFSIEYWRKFQFIQNNMKMSIQENANKEDQPSIFCPMAFTYEFLFHFSNFYIKE